MKVMDTNRGENKINETVKAMSAANPQMASCLAGPACALALSCLDAVHKSLS